jgi:hypothetical protein
MPSSWLLDRVSLPAFFVIAMISLSVAIEGGFYLGTLRRTHSSTEKDAPVGAVVAATLGLVGFILAMTFSFAVARFEGRQEAFLAELNAIGTTYLRSDFLPEPQRERSKEALREYIDVRKRAVETRAISEVIALSEELHSKLWKTVLELAPHDLNAISVTLYIESLNNVIDLHEERVMAGLHLRIPPTLWAVLLTISILGMGEIGYQTALAGSARTPVSLGLVLAFAILLSLVADLDRPHEGRLRVNQRAMEELRQRTR